MGIFGKIMDKIFHHEEKAAPVPSGSAQARPAPTGAPVSSQPPPQAAPPAQSPRAVDVGAVLAAMADAKGGGGNYQGSIVDLLKLLDLDSGLAARKELADELGVHAAADGSAEQNMALHRAVIAKLADNGGIVPDSLRNQD